MLFSSASSGLRAASAMHAAAPLAAPPSKPLTLTQGGAARRPRFALTGWDFAGMLAGFLFILAVTVVNSRGRIFWEDEMLGWLLLRDPSWHHMIRAWNLGADGGGFSFYLLGRAWFAVFGATPLTFRLFSGTCFGLAFATFWAALRRFFPIGTVAFATANTFFFSTPLLMHYIEGRFYGLLLWSTALAILLVFLLEDTPNRTPPLLLLAAFLVHGLLTTSHVLGVVFSFFLLSATFLLDHLRRRRRWPLYLAVASSWLLLLPERTSIVAAGRVGQPHFWTRRPNAWDVLGAYTGYSTEVLLVLLVLLCGAVLTLSLGRGGLLRGLRDSFERRRPLYVVIGMVLLVPLFFLLQGLTGTWLFNSRYLQPVTASLALPTAELAWQSSRLPWLLRALRRWPRLSAVFTTAGGLGFVLLAVFWAFHHVSMATPEAPDFTDQLTAHLPHTLPVVVDDAFTFTGLMSRQADAGVPYIFLLDWPYSLSDAAPRLEVTQFHLMQNWKRAGFFPGHIQEAEPFLRLHAQFFVVHSGGLHPLPGHDTAEIGNPWAQRLAQQQGYEVRPVFTLDRLHHDATRVTVYLVCRGTCNAQATLQPDRCAITSRGTSCCTGVACTLPGQDPPERFWQIRFSGRTHR